MKLCKIWRVQHNKDKPPFTLYMKIEFDPVKRTWAYPLVEVLSSYHKFGRADVVNVDRNLIEKNCQYLNEMADEDVHYEIREYTREEDEVTKPPTAPEGKKYVRDWQCYCGHKFTADVVLSDSTTNLSGEQTWCPHCGKKPQFGSPAYLKDKD